MIKSMSISLRFSTLTVCSIVLTLVFFMVVVSSLSPMRAHAATLSLVAATTTSNNASTTLAKVGNTVSFGLELSGTPSATSTPTINIFNMGTTSMTGSGTYWTYSTTSASSWTNGFLTFFMAWGGSLGEATTTVTQTSLTGANVRFDKTAPTISSITSSANCSRTSGTQCIAGDTIIFTLTPGATEYGGSVSGSYNGQSLTWSTSNNGATYTATYTTENSHAAQSSPLQISGVVITDAAGNASSSGSGSDITVTISTAGSSGGKPVIVVYTSSTDTVTASSTDTTVVASTSTPPAATTTSPAASLPSATYARDLMFGRSGADVNVLQLYLIQQGVGPAARALLTHGATNYFGPLTRAALAEFQKTKGIKPALGYFGPITRAFITGK